jgi:hypothetical protein
MAPDIARSITAFTCTATQKHLKLIECSLCLFTNFGVERHGVALQAHLDGPRPFLFMIKVIEAVHAVAIVAKLSISKTITIPVLREKHA